MSTPTQADEITLEQWVTQFPVRQAATQVLWKAIYREFSVQEPPMTVRQVFYRKSATGHVEKTEGGYRRVQQQLTRMREAGAIPYGWIADNTRWVRKVTTFSSLADMLSQSQQFYRRALWDTQADHVEIWLEKDALSGVIYPVTAEYDVDLYVTRGYPSLSYLHGAAEALRCIDKPKYIYHFGDFDASGKDAARAIREGLQGFGAHITFTEIAVTKAQIDAMQLQTRPAKKSDPRAARWGEIAVELDAIPPATLRDLVRQTIEQHINHHELDRLKMIERQERGTLNRIIRDFGTSTQFGGAA